MTVHDGRPWGIRQTRHRLHLFQRPDGPRGAAPDALLLRRTAERSGDRRKRARHHWLRRHL